MENLSPSVDAVPGQVPAASRPSPKTMRNRRTRKPRARRGAPIKFGADASVDTAIAVVIANTRDHWLANEAALPASGDVEAIHQFRVGLRRFRSALSLFKKYLPKSQREWLNGEAKWVLSEFGPTRDLDVLITELIPAADTGKHGDAFATLRRAAAESRKAAETVALRALKAPRYGRFLRRLETWLAGAGWRAARDVKGPDGGKVQAADFAARAIEKRVLKILAHGKNLNEMSSADRHDIRIAIKKCRYGIEFFSDALPKRGLHALGKRLKALQDGLGHSNDVDVAEHMIEALHSSAKVASVKADIAKAGKALIAHHRRLEKKSGPKAAREWRGLRSALLS